MSACIHWYGNWTSTSFEQRTWHLLLTSTLLWAYLQMALKLTLSLKVFLHRYKCSDEKRTENYRMPLIILKILQVVPGNSHTVHVLKIIALMRARTKALCVPECFLQYNKWCTVAWVHIFLPHIESTFTRTFSVGLKGLTLKLFLMEPVNNYIQVYCGK